VDVRDLQSETASVTDGRFDLLSEVSDREDDSLSAMFAEQLELVLDEWASRDGQQRLR
jgi:hypothetical protein